MTKAQPKQLVYSTINRSILGPDLVFVILTMDDEDVRRRLKDRHGDKDEALDLLEV